MPDPKNTDLPAIQGFAITPHATNPVSPLPREIYVGTTGDIACRFAGSEADVTLKAVPAGSRLPYRLRYIRVTGTTAADLVGVA